MAVLQTLIKQQLIDMTNILKDETDSDAAIEKWSEELAQIITDAILSADVLAGIPVTTAGSATTQTGATTSSGSLQ
jgi:hypothetical protein